MRSKKQKIRQAYWKSGVGIALFALLLSVASVRADQKALLVSINNYPDGTNPLYACHNDAALMRSVLEDVYGFPSSGILELKDREVTAAGLTEAIKDHLIRDTKPGDTVVFYYAGHGTFVKDFDGDEADGSDETLMTYDFDPLKKETWFTDDLIFELFSRIPTQQVLEIHDCCYSGTGNRGASDPLVTSGGANGVAFRFSDAGYRTFELDESSGDTAHRRSGAVTPAAGNPNHVFLAACRKGQLAQEYPISKTKHGIFTYHLAQAMRSNPGVSFENLSKQVIGKVGQTTATTAGLRKQDPTSDLGKQGQVAVSDYLRQSQHFTAPDPAIAPTGEGIPVQRIPTLEEVAPGFHPSGSITLTLSTNKTSYQVDDLMDISLMTSIGAYIELYYYGVDDKVYRIFPNRFVTDSYVKAGQRIHLPGELDFQFRQYLPKNFVGTRGNEVLKAIASTKPFSEMESKKNQKDLFQQVDGRKLNPAQNRLIEVIKRGREFGEAMVIYEIKK